MHGTRRPSFRRKTTVFSHAGDNRLGGFIRFALKHLLPELFGQIKNLPKKARTAKKFAINQDSLLTYFRYGKIQKFFISNEKENPEELDFMSAARILESNPNEKREPISAKYYAYLGKNKDAFKSATTEELVAYSGRSGRDSSFNILKILKATLKNSNQLTEEQEAYIKKLALQIEAGGIPKQTTKETFKALSKLGKDITNPLKVLAVLQMNIPPTLLQSHYAEQNLSPSGKREVILSVFLNGENNG